MRVVFRSRPPRHALFTASLLCAASPIATAVAATGQGKDPAHRAAAPHSAQPAKKALRTRVAAKADPEAITVTSSRARRFHQMANTVNTLSGRQLEQFHIVSPKEICGVCARCDGRERRFRQHADLLDPRYRSR